MNAEYAFIGSVTIFMRVSSIWISNMLEACCVVSSPSDLCLCACVENFVEGKLWSIEFLVAKLDSEEWNTFMSSI